MQAINHVTAAGALSLPAASYSAGGSKSRSARVISYPCPRCSSFAVRRSRVHTTFDLAMRLIGVAPYRCHRCYLRFRRFVPLMYVALGYQPGRPPVMESNSCAEGSRNR